VLQTVRWREPRIFASPQKSNLSRCLSGAESRTVFLPAWASPSSRSVKAVAELQTICEHFKKHLTFSESPKN
jgi:hypothetical protein